MNRRVLAEYVSNCVQSVPLATEQTMGPVASELFGGSIPNLGEFMAAVVEEIYKHAKQLERPLDTSDNSLHFLEEYTLETEKGQGRIYLTRSILADFA